MVKLKNGVWAIAVIAILYVSLWVFGTHGHTYYVEDAKLDRSEWTCPPGEDGPFDGNTQGRHNPVCHVPARECPSLWFPYASVVPCPYRDPLGGPWTKDDEYVLEQIRHPQPSK